MRRIAQLLEGLVPGTRVLLRADLNVPLECSPAGEVRIADDGRIRSALPTLRQLVDRGARVVLCSHLGRPDGPTPQLSMAPIAEHVATLLAHPVTFLAGEPGCRSQQEAIAAAPPGAVFLLDNLRFWSGEKSNDAEFVRGLSSLAEQFVNDAFGTCHRAHASVVGVTGFLPSWAGNLVAKEIDALTGLRDRPARPFWVILGGAKVSDKLNVVAKLAQKVDGFLVGGGMANTFLAGLGTPVGTSRIEADRTDELSQLVHDTGDVDWVFPIDFIAGDSPREPQRTATVKAGEEPGGALGYFDVGPATCRLFADKLATAATVFWNGPLGVFEEPAFAHGTASLCQALESSGAHRVIGGGDTAAAVRQFGVADRMDHVSTGGGASLVFLEGKTLPGIQALTPC